MVFLILLTVILFFTSFGWVIIKSLLITSEFLLGFSFKPQHLLTKTPKVETTEIKAGAVEITVNTYRPVDNKNTQQLLSV